MKIKLIFLFCLILCTQQVNSQIFDEIKYIGKSNKSEMNLTMYYMGNFFKGKYSIVGNNKVFQLISKKGYTEEVEKVILYQYEDKGFKGYPEIMEAINKPTSYLVFTLEDLENYGERTKMKGTLYSADGKLINEYIFYKQKN